MPGAAPSSTYESKLTSRLDLIDQKLDEVISRSVEPQFRGSRHYGTAIAGDEIDLRELWGVIWGGRWIITAITFVFAAASVIYALSLPNMYKSTVVLAPKDIGGGGALGALASQYGGLASLAGINLRSEGGGRLDQAILLLESRAFLADIIGKYNILPDLLAGVNWDFESDSFVYNSEVYSVQSRSWVRGEPALADWNAFNKLRKMLHVTKDDATGMLYLTVEHFSPEIAYRWLQWVKLEINMHYRDMDVRESRENISFLENKIAETTVTAVRSALYGMVESELKVLMLAEVSDEYLLQTVVPAWIPELKSSPSRGVICVFFTLLGVAVGVVFIILRLLRKKWG